MKSNLLKIKNEEQAKPSVYASQSSGVATIFGPPANNLFGPLAKGLR